MKKVWVFLVGAILAACAAEEGSVNRNLAKPMTSIALFDPARFSGQWDVVASYNGQVCAFTAVAGQGAALDWGERGCTGTVTHSVAPITGPGRFTPVGGARRGHEHWVLWVDHAYRTAVIGTPDGSFGMILNRGADIPADRLKAAREILDWNGYDLSRLLN